jgi:hypothetical protein
MLIGLDALCAVGDCGARNGIADNRNRSADRPLMGFRILQRGDLASEGDESSSSTLSLTIVNNFLL